MQMPPALRDAQNDYLILLQRQSLGNFFRHRGEGELRRASVRGTQSRGNAFEFRDETRGFAHLGFVSYGCAVNRGLAQRSPTVLSLFSSLRRTAARSIRIVCS